MRKLLSTLLLVLMITACSNTPKLDITGRYYNNMNGVDSADYWEIHDDGTWLRMTHTGIPFEGTWEDVSTTTEWNVPAREIRMKDDGDSVWHICFIPDSAEWMLTRYDDNGNRTKEWYAIKQ